MDNLVEKRLKQPIAIYIILLLVSAIFTFLFSKSTSPLYCYYGYDSSIFITMGKMVLDGKILYRDCFDHKGPILFFIQALGQVGIQAPTGLFFLHIINLFVTLLFLYKISIIFTNSRARIIFTIFSFLLLLSITIDDGNQTEELSLPYSLITIYITLKYFFFKSQLTLLKAIVIGVCFSFIFWIRPSNAGIICACILFLYYLYIQQRQWKQLKLFTIALFITFAAISGLIIIYFVYNDALNDMVYAVFIFNFKYMKLALNFYFDTLQVIESVILNTIIIITLVAGTYYYYKKTKNKNIIVFTVLLITLNIIPVNSIKMGLFQYKTLLIPCFSIGLMLIFSSKLKISNSVFFKSLNIIIIILLAYIFGFTYLKYQDYDTDYTISAKKMRTYIPNNEKDEVFGYQVEAKIFIITDLKPFFKYYIFQEWHSDSDPRILNETNRMVIEKRPKWIFTENKLMENSRNKIMQNALRNRYKVIYKDNNLTLYKENINQPNIKE